ncbi:aldose 1-epimerase family protein [Bifidobacterium sp. 82T24]|nr:aldose 1-epimerase family protein [Bifidobacterium pluvialisilvae]
MRAIEVKNGPMRFVSMADKALDVSQLEYHGENLTFLSKPGLNGRNQFDTNGAEAQRSIMGGLFFTCGFENIGAPYTDAEGKDFPMHGRIRTTPAEHVSSDAYWNAQGEYVMTISGEVREAELFGENLVMRRTISTVYGRPEIVVDDVVTNEGFRDEPLMWMYHCNFGWPLLAEGAQVIIPSRHAEPRNEDAANDPTPWSEIGEPVPNKPESVYIHTLAAGEDGRSFAAVANRAMGLGVSVEFDAADFPYFMQWKSVASGDYVVGLEPANSSVRGRGYHERRGDLHTIAPGASEHKRVTFRIHEGDDALDALERRRAELLA